MWGIHNVTGSNATFRRFSAFGIEVITGFVEEITFNIKFTQPAGAFEVPEIPSKSTIIKNSSAVAISVVTSSSLQKQTLRLIGGATANLINYM